MKVLKLFVILSGGLIVFVLLALFVVGRRPTAGRVRGMTEIDAPPATVMQWLTEPAKLKKWVGWLSAVQGDSIARVGRKQVWIMDDGRTGAVSVTTELVVFAPPDSMRMRLVVPGMVEGDNRYTLADLGGSTVLVVDGKYRHPNFVLALLEPLMTPEAGAKLRSDLERLRVAVKRAAADTSAATGADSSATAGTDTTGAANGSLGVTR